jgi:sporulation protein YlmC with PRC-barrel domain
MSDENRNTDSANHSDGPGPALMGANTLIGNYVYNEKEEELGNIKEIMLDTQRGNVRYAVLSSGGFLGMGDKLFAVPWSALTLDTENQRFILNVEADDLKNAPGFDKDQWPNMADTAWEEGIHSYYETPLHRMPQNRISTSSATKPNIQPM